MFATAAAAIRRLNEARLPVVVVTNQSGVGRGYFPDALVHTVHGLMKQQISVAGAHVDAIYYCPHTSEDGCACRKPKPGLLQQAARELGLELRRSFVVGDRYGDVELAHRVGARGVLVRTGYGAGEEAWQAEKWRAAPDFVADDLAGAVEWILRERK